MPKSSDIKSVLPFIFALIFRLYHFILSNDLNVLENFQTKFRPAQLTYLVAMT